jgi:hypothetical protein
VHLQPQPGMVDFEKFSIIEIKINRIKIFLKISKSIFIESVFQVLFFDFGITSRISKNYDSIYFDTKFNRCYFDKYQIVSFL